MGAAADLVSRYIQEVWNDKDLSALDELCLPDYRRHVSPGDVVLDLAAQKQRLADMFAAFPDMTAELADVVEGADRVAFRVIFRGTHLGPFRGLAATGRPVHTQAVDIVALADGRITEHWGVFDLMALADQIQ